MSSKTSADDALIARWICPARRYPGDPEARIADLGIPVWALIGHYLAGGRDATATASDYNLPREAIEAAIAYYRLHRDVIDARLLANETAPA